MFVNAAELMWSIQQDLVRLCAEGEFCNHAQVFVPYLSILPLLGAIVLSTLI